MASLRAARLLRSAASSRSGQGTLLRCALQRRAGFSAVQQSDIWGGAVPHDVGSANLSWEELGFDYIPTHGHVRHVWKDGEWDHGSFQRDPFISVHILGNVFHYGQALFEGFKVYHMKDGSVGSFVDELSLQRMEHGCRRFRMPGPPKDLWRNALEEVVRQNISFVPPYGSGGALYVRPFMFGSGPRLGLGPSTEYTFIMFANPVGSYYKAGTMQSIDALVMDEYDRAAPLGCGDVKAAGNYAADLESMVAAKRKGFMISLYLDGKERRYVEEFNTSNFVGITKDGRYVTPDAPRSVLNSNTNKVLVKLAEDMGLKVERRRIDFEAEIDSFAEVGAVGTAVVVTPIKSFTRGDKKWELGPPSTLMKLHDRVRAIQQGEEEDPHNFVKIITPGAPQMMPHSSIYPAL
eukprot:TRINITY_DN9457_c0_g1_i1.p1 TRINITY_DN9457_c0_g1~~TRINITY_DN9457_c0_g1_i1.p1  ORF type:complete len:406 (-),score=84.03 TRINITY_DN9457_c0_g1_i1:413-1630(-)